MTTPFQPSGIDFDYLRRLEAKVDRINDNVERLVLVEERQTVQGDSIDVLTKELTVLTDKFYDLQRKVDKYIWIFSGITGTVGVIWVLIKFVADVAIARH